MARDAVIFTLDSLVDSHGELYHGCARLLKELRSNNVRIGIVGISQNGHVHEQHDIMLRHKLADFATCVLWSKPLPELAFDRALRLLHTTPSQAAIVDTTLMGIAWGSKRHVATLFLCRQNQPTDCKVPPTRFLFDHDMLPRTLARL